MQLQRQPNNTQWQRSSQENVSYDEGHQSEVIPGTSSQKHPTKRARSRAALLADIPTPELLSKVLAATCSWWQTWYVRHMHKHLSRLQREGH
jgi:hypothetical protein